MADIRLVQDHLSKVVQYLKPLLPLANCHMVNFFTGNLWDKFVLNEIKTEYSKIGLPGLYKIFFYATKPKDQLETEPEISLVAGHPFTAEHFITAGKLCLNPDQEFTYTHKEFLNKLKSLGYQAQDEYAFKGFMAPKKLHEVQMMSQVVSAIAKRHQINHIVDVGDGKGYLSSVLAFHHRFHVLGIDSSYINTHGAAVRTKKLQKYWRSIHTKSEEATSREASNVKYYSHRGKHWKAKASVKSIVVNADTLERGIALSGKNKVSSNLYCQTTMYISEESNLSELLEENFPNSSPYKFALVGLHTCGNLAATCLRQFTTNSCIRALCNVGCCYHLMDEKYSPNPFINDEKLERECGFPMSEFLTAKNFSLGRNARMLAAQAVGRLSEKDEVPVNNLFFRALLQVLLCQHFGDDRADWQVGRIASKSQDFADYVKKAKEKLNLETMQIPMADLDEFYKQHLQMKDYLEAFFLFRVALAPVIETAIVLDRLLYLLEQGVHEVHLVQLFDSVISPRCYGLIALKDCMPDLENKEQCS